MRDVALLYSGGLDSFVALHHARSLDVVVTPVFVHLGLGSSGAESEAIARQKNATGLLGDLQVVVATATDQLPDGVVPGRNLLLATIAARYGGEVWLSALHGEMHPYTNRDKSHEFFLMASAVLTYCFRPVREVTTVTTPFLHRTKADVVALGLDLGLTGDDFALTRSCYRDGPVPCGECKGCLHRWIAMTLNDLREQHTVAPWTTLSALAELDACREALLRGDHDHYDERRCRETLAAFERVHVG